MTATHHHRAESEESVSVTTEPQAAPQSAAPVAAGAFAPRQLLAALSEALRKLDPRVQARNPVMFVVWVGSVLVTVLAVADPSVFAVLVAVWLWFTVLFANLAEAVAEDGQGPGRVAARHPARHRRPPPAGHRPGRPGRGRGAGARRHADARRPGRRRGGETIPGDGDVVHGIASVDESAITGESAPVIREAGGDRCAVTGGTTVLSDRIVVRITTKPGSPSSTG